MSSNPYRKDFPLLENNKVIYLDNAATSQRPEAVIQAEAQFYDLFNGSSPSQYIGYLGNGYQAGLICNGIFQCFIT